MIPRIFHRIWLGRRRLPDEFQRYGESWLQHNPGWRLLTWTDKHLPPMVNQKEFDAAGSPAFRADVLRYELLYRYGGVYLDTDMQALRPLGSLLDGVKSFCALEKVGFCGTAILGSEPQSNFFAWLLASLPHSFESNSSPANRAGPDFFNRKLSACPEADKPAIFPAKHFYPYGYWERRKAHQHFPEAYGVHHWLHSWR